MVPHNQLRVVNLPWSQLQFEATQRDESLSVVLTSFINALSLVALQYRGCIFSVKRHTLRVQHLMFPILSQIEKLRAYMDVLTNGARSKANMSPFTLLRLHSELCLLRMLCFSCTTPESAAVRSARHMQALMDASITLSVSRGSKTAERKRRRAEAAARVAAHTAAQAGNEAAEESLEEDEATPDCSPDPAPDCSEDDMAPQYEHELWLRAAKSLPHRDDLKACLRLYKQPVSGSRGQLEARLADYWCKNSRDPDMIFVIDCLIEALPPQLAREVREAMEGS